MNRSLDAGDTNNGPLDYPPLTVLPVADAPRRFYVLGSHEWWYEVELGDESHYPSCECVGFRYRGTCTHYQAAQKFVEGGWPTAAEEAMLAFKAMSDEERKDIWR